MTLLCLDVIIGLLIGYIFLNETLSKNKLIGALLLIIGIIYKSFKI